MTDTEHKPNAAKYRPGHGPTDTDITFTTPIDRRLFQAALNVERHLNFQQAMEVVYAGALCAFTAADPIECGDFTLGRMKGVISPIVAMMSFRQGYCGKGHPLEVTHVWLRHSQDAACRYNDWNHTITDGNPNGRGGSYKGTIVGSPCDMNTYTTKVEPTKADLQIYRTTAFLKSERDLFFRRVSQGVL